MILRLSCGMSNSSTKLSQSMLSVRLLSIGNNALLFSLSLVIEFLRKIFTIFIWEKLLSQEAIVTGSVIVIGNNLYKQSNAVL